MSTHSLWQSVTELAAQALADGASVEDAIRYACDLTECAAELFADRRRMHELRRFLSGQCTCGRHPRAGGKSRLCHGCGAKQKERMRKRYARTRFERAAMELARVAIKPSKRNPELAKALRDFWKCEAAKKEEAA